MSLIYLDNNATTPIIPEVREAMLPYLGEFYGNPGSIHAAGRPARKAVEDARGRLAALLGCGPENIIFTSCGTESDNTAIMSALWKAETKTPHIITTAVEHPAVWETCKRLNKLGWAKVLSVDNEGLLDLQELKDSITDDTVLVTVMWGNNETGVIFPVEEIGAICREKGVLFHTDAVQAVTKVPMKLAETPIDTLALSGHKFHAPKGVGALYVRKGLKPLPFVTGGHQERGLRAGTENVASIVGMGVAAEAGMREMDREIPRIKALRDRLEKGIEERIPEVLVNGHRQKRLATTLNVSFKYIEGESILLHLDLNGICASSGSACTSGSLDPSHVLLAIGLGDYAHGSVRFSFGRGNTEQDVDRVLEVLPGIIERLRALSPLSPKEMPQKGGAR